jgi:hypothetical protein
MTKSGTLAAAAVTALALGSVLASAATATDTDDHYKPAGATIRFVSARMVFSEPPTGGVIVTCTNSTTNGKTPTSGLGEFAIAQPKFNDGYATTGAPKVCTDNLQGTEVITTSGSWAIGFIDAANDETTTEPNTGDRFRVFIPKGGMVIKSSLGATCTVAPSAPFSLVGSYTDVNKLTFDVRNVPVFVAGGTGWPPGTMASFQAVFTLSPGVSDAS